MHKVLLSDISEFSILHDNRKEFIFLNNIWNWSHFFLEERRCRLLKNRKTSIFRNLIIFLKKICTMKLLTVITSMVQGQSTRREGASSNKNLSTEFVWLPNFSTLFHQRFLSGILSIPFCSFNFKFRFVCMNNVSMKIISNYCINFWERRSGSWKSNSLIVELLTQEDSIKFEMFGL